jgi:hypothetical protein
MSFCFFKVTTTRGRTVETAREHPAREKGNNGGKGVARVRGGRRKTKHRISNDENEISMPIQPRYLLNESVRLKRLMGQGNAFFWVLWTIRIEQHSINSPINLES